MQRNVRENVKQIQCAMNLKQRENQTAELPQSVYIHIPFCRHRCGYCNFTLIADRDRLIDRYLDALQIEMQSLAQQSVETIFIGGGTPTHLSESQLEKLFSIITEKFSIVESGEFR